MVTGVVTRYYYNIGIFLRVFRVLMPILDVYYFKLLLPMPTIILLEHSMDRVAGPYWLPNGGRKGVGRPQELGSSGNERRKPS